MDYHWIFVANLLSIFLQTLAANGGSIWLATQDDIVITKHQDSKTFPLEFRLNLSWTGYENKTMHIELQFHKRDVVQKNLPIHKGKLDGRKIRQFSIKSLKDVEYYQDPQNLGTASLKAVNDQFNTFNLRGGFVHEDVKYKIESYNSNIHGTRIIRTNQHQIVIEQVSTTVTMSDYREPPPGTVDEAVYRYMQQVGQKGRIRSDKQAPTLMSKVKVKRQSLSATDYVVQIYMVVDYYLYQTTRYPTNEPMSTVEEKHFKLAKLATDLSWSGGVNDFIPYYMGHLANEVDIRFRSITTASFTISTKLSYLYIADTTGKDSFTYSIADAANKQVEADQALDKLQTWIDATPNLPEDADHFMLMTSLDLWSRNEDGSKNTDTAGLASVSGACLTAKVSVNEFSSSATAAHELGHNLGAEHDGSNNACSGNDQYVMAATAGSTTTSTRGNLWKFSSCSISYFETFIQTLNGDNRNCLSNSGTYISEWADDFSRRVGQDIPVDKQCELVFGDSNYVFAAGANHSAEICRKQWCVNLNDDQTRSDQGAMEYTTCGDRKWCVQEECVSDPAAPAADASCPHGDLKGKLFSNSDKTCEIITGSDCYTEFVRTSCCSKCPSLENSALGSSCLYGDKTDCSSVSSGAGCYSGNNADVCCGTCAQYKKSWLGPNCEYGDKASGCQATSSSCSLNTDLCCDTCCSINGATQGYSCVQLATQSSAGEMTTSNASTVEMTTSKASIYHHSEFLLLLILSITFS